MQLFEQSRLQTLSLFELLFYVQTLITPWLLNKSIHENPNIRRRVLSPCIIKAVCQWYFSASFIYLTVSENVWSYFYPVWSETFHVTLSVIILQWKGLQLRCAPGYKPISTSLVCVWVTAHSLTSFINTVFSFFYLLNCLYLFWSIPRGTLLLFLPRTVSKRLKAKDGVQPESALVLRWGKTQVGHRHVWGSLLKTTSIERFYLSTMQQTPAVKVITAHH